MGLTSLAHSLFVNRILPVHFRTVVSIVSSLDGGQGKDPREGEYVDLAPIKSS